MSVEKHRGSREDDQKKLMGAPLGEAGLKKEPLQVFPEEVWLTILTMLPQQDQFNCYHASATFHNLLFGLRVEMLGPLVLPLLHWDYDQVPGRKMDLLNCRRVCRSWKRSVDDFCERVPLPGHSTRFRISKPESFFQNRFQWELEIEDFEALMITRPLDPRDNPFISRSVLFDDNEVAETIPEEIPNFWNRVAGLVDHFGKHIWHCQMIFHQREVHSVGFVYNHIARICQNCPNLRTLTISAPHLSMRVPQTELVRLLSVPMLPHLVGLRCDTGDTPILRLLLRSAVNPTVLEVLDVGKNDPNASIAVYDFTHLKEVKFGMKCELDLSELQCVPWPLTKAAISVQLERKHRRNGGITFTSMFLWLSKFGRTLEDLELTLTGNSELYGNRRFSDSHLRLLLPNLTKLCIMANRVGIFSLDFALELRRLETLTIRMSTEFSSEYNPEEQIQFAGLEAVMVPSNIWTVFPNLTNLHLQDSCSGYRYRRRMDSGLQSHFTMKPIYRT